MERLHSGLAQGEVSLIEQSVQCSAWPLRICEQLALEDTGQDCCCCCWHNPVFCSRFSSSPVSAVSLQCAMCVVGMRVHTQDGESWEGAVGVNQPCRKEQLYNKKSSTWLQLPKLVLVAAAAVTVDAASYGALGLGGQQQQKEQHQQQQEMGKIQGMGCLWRGCKQGIMCFGWSWSKALAFLQWMICQPSIWVL